MTKIWKDIEEYDPSKLNLVCHHGLHVNEIALILNLSVKETMTRLRNEIREQKLHKH
jgi:hypothetical protein